MKDLVNPYIKPKNSKEEDDTYRILTQKNFILVNVYMECPPFWVRKNRASTNRYLSFFGWTLSEYEKELANNGLSNYRTRWDGKKIK